MSRTRGAGAGSRAIKCVAYERNWCRIACRQACRGRKEPVPDRVRYGPSPDLVSSHPGPPWRPHVSAMLTVRRTARPSSAMPRPNIACSRRCHRRFTNVYSFTPPWRSLRARSAARLRPSVGPLHQHPLFDGTMFCMRHTLPTGVL